MTDCCNNQHPDHSPDLSRINRIAGQIEGIKKMIGERRYCPEIITQLKAVQSAVKSVEANILQRHLEGCVKDVLHSKDPQGAETKLGELVQLFKKN
jgi:DNA-binding FrmR family transcriptional regulator